MIMTDEQIAATLEMRYGLGYTWKRIARMSGMNYWTFYSQVYRALHRGMRSQ